MAEPDGTTTEVGGVDTDQDRYPNIYDVLTALQHEADLPNGPLERIEITCQANGEANVRLWEPRAEEPEGRFLPFV